MFSPRVHYTIAARYEFEAVQKLYDDMFETEDEE